MLCSRSLNTFPCLWISPLPPISPLYRDAHFFPSLRLLPVRSAVGLKEFLLLPLVLELLLVRNRQAVDAEKVAYAGGDEVRPAEVDSTSKSEVGPEVVELGVGGDGLEPEAREVGEGGAADERREHDGPVGEGLARQVREDHLGGHAAEHKRHGQAEEHQVVIAHQRRVRRVQPRADAERVHAHRDPLEEDGEHRQVVPPPRLHYVQHAERHVPEQQRQRDRRDPDVPDRVFARQMLVPEQVVLPDDVDDALRPDARPADAGDRHDAACD